MKFVGFLLIGMGLVMTLISPFIGILFIIFGVYLMLFKKSTKSYSEHQKNYPSDYEVSVDTQRNNKYKETLSYDYIKARKLVDDIVVLDFETTGLSPINDEIIQVGAIKYKNGRIIDQFNRYAKPSKPISSRITNLTGITNKMVENAPLLEKTLIELEKFLSGYTLVAHNAPFDMKFLIENFNRYNIKHDRFRVIDTLVLARKYIDETENHKLVTLKDFLKIEADSHDAFEDCRVTGSLYYYCKDIEDNIPGNYKGKHFTEYRNSILEMKRANENIEAIDLLLNLVDAVEAESKAKNFGPVPWYYEQLAILYRKEKQLENEVGILERYLDVCKLYGVPNGAKHLKLIERYEKLIN